MNYFRHSYKEKGKIAIFTLLEKGEERCIFSYVSADFQINYTSVPFWQFLSDFELIEDAQIKFPEYFI